jgi:hypothetical protein
MALDPVQKMLSGMDDPDDVVPGSHVSLPEPKQYPPGYWEECNALQKQAVEASGALYANICIKETGPMFAVTALVPGRSTYVEGPGRADRPDAWKAFIEQYQAS